MRRLALLALLAACGPPAPPKDDGTSGQTGATGDSGTQVMMMEKPPRATTVTKAIDAGGGEIRLDTAAGLTFPPGALSDSTILTIREVDEAIAGYTMYSKVYYFEPEGQMFADAFIAEIAFGGDIASAKLYWSQPGDINAFDEIDGIALGTTMTAAVNHFSRAFVGSKLPVTVTLNPPPAPGGLVAKAGDTDVDLTWQAAAGATLYKIYGSTVSGGPYALLNTATLTGYTHSDLTNGTPYFYVVKANNADGDSAQSNEASATPLDLEAPAGLGLARGNTVLTLSWQAPPHATASTTYRVFRDTVPIGDTANVVYADLGRTNGVTYTYTVVALDPDLNPSAFPPSDVSAFAFKYPGPFSPSGPAGCSYDIAWPANADGTDHYSVTFKIAGSDFVPGPTGLVSPTFQCAFRFDSDNNESNSVTTAVQACYDATENQCGGTAEFILPFPVGCTGVTTCP
jgi:hypothetical protein